KLFYIKPGANSKDIKVRIEGARTIKVNKSGQLEVQTELGVVRFTKPVAYQEKNGKKVKVNVKYRLIKTKTGLIYSYKLGKYDKTKEIVIDPLLASTFLGSSGRDLSSSITINSAGNIYIAGYTLSLYFPTTPGAYATSFNSDYYDVFISKLNNNLSSILSSTFLGGSNDDYLHSIVIDSSDNIYVVGSTMSSDFPTTPDAYDTSFNGDTDGFVSKLSSDLTTLLASTLLGGVSNEQIYSIAMDPSETVYIAGSTMSSDFPTTPDAYDTFFKGGSDAFTAKLSNDLTTLLASTFLGGSHSEYARFITVDSLGNVYTVGNSRSSDFPATSGAYDTSFNGNFYSDVFISKLNGDLTSLLASTFLGGVNEEHAFSAILDSSGNIYIAGTTYSSDFPTTPGAYDTYFNNGPSADVFISEIDSDLTSLLASTFLGGSNSEFAGPIAIGPSGDVYVVGSTFSLDFPIIPGAYSVEYSGYTDVFVSKLSGDLTTLLASTFLGGNKEDYAYSIAMDSSSNIFLAGNTFSSDFPTTPGAYDTFFNGNTDAFVSKLDTLFSENAIPGVLSVTPSDGLTSSGYQGGPFSPLSKTFTLTNTGGSAINWTASQGQAWVTPSPTTGTLPAGTSIAVTVSINSNADGLLPGTYTDTVNFINMTNGNGDTTRPVSLTVATSLTLYSATLTWDAPTTNVDGTPLTDLAGYKIYYGTLSHNYTVSMDVGGASCQEIGDITECTYTVDGLPSGTYYFAVTAYNISEYESEYSNEASKTFQ
ncbi:MAG: SBBP repeat-containing protein, partial [Nitrospirota bacterium]